MCGIAALFLPDQSALSNEHELVLQNLEKHLRFRGPDASGIVTEDSVGLVHTRLSIVDLDTRSNQPLMSQDWILSFNGEIINYKTIRLELEFKYNFKTQSDSEVLLLALQEWGLENTLIKIAGMYAFIAYNRIDKTLYAVRDRLGIKPLFIHKSSSGFHLICSSPAALAKAHNTVSWLEDKSSIASYFLLGAPFHSGSAIFGIQRIPPASYMKIAPNGLADTIQYWEPQFQEQFSIDDLNSVIQEYGNSDVNSALFLSGGIDSTYLASVMSNSNLDYFHLRSPEKKYALRVAAHYGKRINEVVPDLEKYSEFIEHVCDTHGEPYSSVGIPYSVCHEAQGAGYKMAISANGADELFFGYPRTPMPEYNGSGFLNSDLVYEWFHEQLSHIFRDKRHFIIEEYDSFMPSLIDLGVECMEKYRLRNFPTSASHRWMELSTYVLNDLNPTLDAASMANGIEVRVPFLDHRIVQGILSKTANEHIDLELGTKSILKRPLFSDFGLQFLTRPKLGFSIDQKSLRGIAKIGSESFKKAKRDEFVKLSSKSSSRHFSRDLIYLERAVFVYNIWKKSFAKIAN